MDRFRVVPLLAFLLYLGLAFGWRVWVQFRHHGGSGILLFRSGGWRQHLRDTAFLVLAAALLLEVVAAARGRVGVAEAVAARVLGLALVLGGTGLTVSAQLDLGASWRIGIDQGAQPGLVETGWYRTCRNPIFLFMLATLAGFVVLIPARGTALVLVLAYAAIRVQVREEERYLLRTYGAPYAAYAARVGRFLPGIGRLGLTATADHGYL
ncbi:MAG: methyltransferase [Candidatus Binatia bacterium]